MNEIQADEEDTSILSLDSLIAYTNGRTMAVCIDEIIALVGDVDQKEEEPANVYFFKTKVTQVSLSVLSAGDLRRRWLTLLNFQSLSVVARQQEVERLTS